MFLHVGRVPQVNHSFNKEFVMPLWLKTTGKWGSVLVILALIVTLLKQVIAFVGFLTLAIKFTVVLAFIALLLGVGFVVLRSVNANRRAKE